MTESPSHRVSFLAQRHVAIDGGSGVWISLKTFDKRQEAETYLSALKLAENGRVIEAVCEPTG